MTVEVGEDFDRILVGFSPEVRDVAREARALIFEVLPQAVEVVWERQRIAGYGTGPKKMTEHFSWIAPAKQHVGLGFNYGTELPDPDHLLEGTSKLFRHVKLTRIEDVHRPPYET